jgi:hypothetical protein
MYQISRSIYRRLAPHVIADRTDPTGSRNRQRVLEACEEAMFRLAVDRRYFAHPERSLFDQIRSCFSIRDQLLVFAVVERYMEAADDYLARLPQDRTAFGDMRQCRASTRRGTPCQREPLPGKDYCPSHKHLEEPDAWRPALSAVGAGAELSQQQP